MGNAQHQNQYLSLYMQLWRKKKWISHCEESLTTPLTTKTYMLHSMTSFWSFPSNDFSSRTSFLLVCDCMKCFPRSTQSPAISSQANHVPITISLNQSQVLKKGMTGIWAWSYDKWDYIHWKWFLKYKFLIHLMSVIFVITWTKRRLSLFCLSLQLYWSVVKNSNEKFAYPLVIE